LSASLTACAFALALVSQNNAALQSVLLAKLAMITGAVTVSSNGNSFTSLTWPAWTGVGTTALTMTANNGLLSVSFPLLTTIAGAVSITVCALHCLRSRVVSAADAPPDSTRTAPDFSLCLVLALQSHTALVSISLPQMATITGTVTVSSNGNSFTSLTWPSWTGVGTTALTMASNNGLLSVSFPLLNTIGGIISITVRRASLPAEPELPD
jgi:hypothetical protein